MPTDLDKALIAFFTRLRVKAGMTQAQVAEAVNATGVGVAWSRASVAALESGRRLAMRVSEVAALCTVHQVSLDDALRGAGAPEDIINAVCGRSRSDS